MTPTVLAVGLEAETSVPNLETAERMLRSQEFAVVLLDRDLAGVDWREAIERLAKASPRSCIVLVSAVNDEYLWREVVHRGGFDVLSKPVRQHDLQRKIDHAWLYWRKVAAVTK